MPVYEEKSKVNGQKRYFIRAYVYDEFGKVKQIERHNKNWIGREGKKEAEWEENRLKNKTNCLNSNIRLYQLCDEYLNELENNTKFATVERHSQNIRIYIKPLFPNEIVNRITTKQALTWKQKINDFPLELDTKKIIFTTFSAIVQHGCKYFGVENNPFKTVGNFTAKKGHKKKEINIITEINFQKFLSVEKNSDYKELYNIYFYTGMRRGELLALTWDDIDFEKRTVNIDKTLDPKKKASELRKYKKKSDNTPKTDKSNRKITVLDTVIDSFKRLKERGFSKPAEFVTLTTLQRHCDNNCKNILHKKIRIHDLRHSFASLCIDKNVPISIISEYLGHENITTTLDTYGHLYPDSQLKLVNLLENKSNIGICSNSGSYVLELIDKVIATENDVESVIKFLEKKLSKQVEKQVEFNAI